MSKLQLALIVAGIVLVVAVVIYNGWQERRLRRTLTRTGAPASDGTARRRVEPTLNGGVDATAHARDAGAGGTAVRGPTELPATPFAIPMDDVRAAPAGAGDEALPEDEPLATDASAWPPTPAQARASAMAQPGVSTAAPPPSGAPPPDPEIEAVARITPTHPVDAVALAPALDVQVGKRLRWLGRAPSGAWLPFTAGAPDAYGEIAACLLLADRNGAIGEAQLGAFLRLASDVARGIDGAVAAPSVAEESRRAQALDRLCADLDIQIGLTVYKPEPASIPGTRLRGVAEAAGFRLAGNGRFEHVHEDTGAVLWTLQNVRNEPFSAESLRLTAVQGVVFLLDVPRVHDPARVFDQMKLAARRMAHTLGAELVDDNRRPLDDAALAKTRAQVQAAAQALADAHIEPGSPRALALFGA